MRSSGSTKGSFRIRWGQACLSLFLGFWALVGLYPIFIMFISSFKKQIDIFMRPFSLPTHFSLRNFSLAWAQAKMGDYFLNSVVVSASTVCLIVLIASMAAYVFARFDFRAKNVLYLLLLAGLVLPGRLALVPQFILVRDLGLLDTRLGLVLVYAAGAMPFAIFILSNFFQRIPKEIEESAIIDGARVWTRYWRITLPLSRPALATIAVFNLVGVWNDFFLPLILLRSQEKMTIPVGLTVFFGEYTVQWPMLFSALSLASIPMIVVFLFMTRQFIAGLTAGALKG